MAANVVPLRSDPGPGAGQVIVRCPGKIRVRAEDCICSATAAHWHACLNVFPVVASIGGDYCPRCHKLCRWPRDALARAAGDDA